MRSLFQAVDTLLRGGFTREEDLRQGRIAASLGQLAAAGILLGLGYGACMGLYSTLRPGGPSYSQLLASIVKVPLLFLLTLVVTYPSLYVFSALANSPLKCLETARFLLLGVVANLALLASFGPVTAFFTLSTDSYPFMIVLNVFFFAASGAAGLVFLNRATRKLFSADGSGGQKADLVFKIWVVVYGVVGAQMGWVLRPFIGSPRATFSFFRERDSNFFEAVIRTLKSLFVSP